MTTLRSTVLSLACLGALVTTTGCPQREVSRIDPLQAKEREKLIPVRINRDVDILFVVDNSQSMAQEQMSLAANFPSFINVLNGIEGGLPNVHLGVVSTDVGAGGFPIAGCGDLFGDEGRLTTNGCGQLDNSLPYITDILDEDTMIRTDNYSGGGDTLEDTFSCMAQLGIDGCGFEQTLESMRRALDPNNAANAGFIRENAFLAIVFITDEDDCSVDDTAMFDTSADAVSTLGKLSSYRCFKFGIECTPDSDIPGERQDCAPRIDPQFMAEVQPYVDFVRGLKRNPRNIITAAITGDSTNVAVTTDNTGDPALAPSCETAGLGKAAPPIRLQTFIEQFPSRNTVTSICQNDLSPALVQIAELLALVIGNPCFEGDLARDDNGRLKCVVSDIVEPDVPELRQETILGHCDDFPPPCWREVADAECTGDAQFGSALEVDRAGAEPPLNTFTAVHCEEN